MIGILLRGTDLTPPSDASHQGLKFSISDCLSSHCYWSTIVICNCTFCADNGGIPPRQRLLLYTFVYPISTPYYRNIKYWWSRSVPPRGPIRLLRARLCPQLNEHLEHTSSMKVLQQKMQNTLTLRLLIFELSISAALCISFACSALRSK